MLITPNVFGREIGIVLSGASAGLAPIALRNDAENIVADEQIVVIYDKKYSDKLMLGVVRWVHRLEPFLRRGVRTVYTDHPDALEDELVLGYSNAWVEIYGAITSSGFRENINAPHPGSRVFLVENGELLSKYIALEKQIVVGEHKYSGWKLPLNPDALRYHVGVFGATGMGKSRLVRALIEEIVEQGYSLIVFDHTGVDYAQPFRAKGYGDHVVESSKIKLSPDIIARLILELSRLSDHYADYIMAATICYASIIEGKHSSVEECFGAKYRVQKKIGGQGKDKWVKEDYMNVLIRAMSYMGARETGVGRVRAFINFFLSDEFFEQLNKRTITPQQLIDMAKKKKFIIVDLSPDTELIVKQAIIADTARAGWEWIFSRHEPINLGLIVDEAQNYAGEGRSISAVELERIAREGRKWGYFIILASQRVARDIRTSIRSNLGTVFFSKLQSTGDLNEIAGYLDLGRLNEGTLAMLAPREFFVAGLMNPLRRPILLRVREVS